MQSFLSVLGCVLYVANTAFALEVRASNWTVGQVVKTSSGPVTGHPATVNTGVSEYLGIPFAIPPVGDLRWTAPQQYNGTSAINGTKFGFSCPAGSSASPSLEQISSTNITGPGLQILASLGQIGDNFSEDCLTLNIWTKPQVGEQKKAVLLWIYGGGFTTGNSDNPGYNGQYIAEQEDVVLVSINYRLNVFGFPGSPNGTYNLGLLDQRLAVEWVRDNIASFGGDPSRITLFGQSAGSASVDYYTYAWADDPIAHSFIQESGSVFGPAGGLGAIPTNQSNAYWFNLTSALSCGGATSDQTAVLSCLKKKSTAEILFALKEITPIGAGGLSTSFAPTVDEKVVFGNYTQRSQAGKFAQRPLLLGNADYEAGLFKVLLAFENMTQPDVYWDGFNNIAFTCPAAARANVSISNNVPTWRYRWFGAFPNTELTTIPFSGAWHASELPVLFDTAPSGPGLPNNTAEEVAIGSHLRGAWATFAKNPTTGLSSYQDGWPMYSPTEESLIRLAYENKTGANLAKGTLYDFFCGPIYEATNVQNTTSKNGSSTPSSSSSSPSGSATVAASSNSDSSSRLLSLATTLAVGALVVVAGLVL